MKDDHMNIRPAQRFLKNSVWEFTKEKVLNDTVLPAGTKFQVVYPRKLVDIPIKFMTPVDLPERRARRRFDKADMIVSAWKLDDTELVSLDENIRFEYYIREKATGYYLMANGHANRSSLDYANACVTVHNAHAKLVAFTFHSENRKTIESWSGKCGAEIIEYDPIAQEVSRIIDFEEDWYANILSLRRAAGNFGGSVQTDIRSLAGTIVPKTGHMVGLAVFRDRNWHRFFLQHPDIEMHSCRNHIVTFARREDMTLTKIILADTVELFDFV